MKEKTMEFLQKEFDRCRSNTITFKGDCHDCHDPVDIYVDWGDDGKLEITGGALYPIQQDNLEFKKFYKCDKCFMQNPTLTDYQDCEVYSRSVGYLRPVKQWNEGKQSEFKNRKMFDVRH